MPTYDGCIKINTKIDTSGFNKGTNSINKDVKTITNSLSSLGQMITATFNKNPKIEMLKNNLQKATREVEQQALKVDELKTKLLSLESGEIKVEDKNVKKLQSDFDRVTESADKTKSKIDELYMQLDNIQRDAFKNPINQEPVLTVKEQNQMSKLNAQLDELESQLLQDREKAKKLGDSLKEATGDSVQSEIKKTKEQLSKAESKLNELSIKAENAGIKLKTNLNQSSNPLTQLNNGFTKLGKKITSLFTRVIVFSVIARALRAILDIIKNVIMSNAEFRNSWYQLQASLWLAITPIINILIPALQKLVQWAAIATNAIVKFAVALSGKNYSDIVKKANALKQQSDAYKDLSKNSKKASKSLAAFDEINTLSKSDTDKSETDFTGLNASNAFKDVSNFDTSSISEKMQTLLKVIAGALIVLGVILLFTGHIGWGIGFIIAGASFFAISAQATSESDPTRTPKEQIATFLSYLGAALLVLGVLILCFGGPSPLSIGLIIAGAASLAAAVALNPEAVKEKVKKFFTDNAGLIVGVSLALLVLGILLLFAQIYPLGIGLIVVGVAGLATEVALNWNAIKEKVSTAINAVVDWIKTWGLLAMGIILIVSGVGMALGLALLLKGGQNLTEAQNPTWLAILDKIKETWSKIKAFCSANIAKYFTSAYWLGLAKGIGNGFISGIEGMTNGVISMFEKMINWIVSGLNKISFDVPEWVPGIGGKKFGFNLSKVDFGRITIPRLAQGGVIPANREFLAILGDQKHGTNIEAPLDTIKQAVAEVIAEFNIGNNNGFNGRIEIPVIINGREILRAVREAEGEAGIQTIFGGFANAY